MALYTGVHQIPEQVDESAVQVAWIHEVDKTLLIDSASTAVLASRRERCQLERTARVGAAGGAGIAVATQSRRWRERLRVRIELWDVLAGISVAVVLVPQSLAYAQLAGFSCVPRPVRSGDPAARRRAVRVFVVPAAGADGDQRAADLQVRWRRSRRWAVRATSSSGCCSRSWSGLSAFRSDCCGPAFSPI